MESASKVHYKSRAVDAAFTLRPRIVFQLAAVSTCVAATLLLLTSTDYWLTGLWTGLAAVFLFARLAREITAAENQLVTFLQALKESDFTLRFPENETATRFDLHATFNQLSTTYRELRRESESQHSFLEMIVETVSVPILCVDVTNGRIALFNTAAKDLFSIPVLPNVAGLQKISDSLPDFLMQLPDGRKKSYPLTINHRSVHLSIVSRTMQFEDRRLKLVALQDVSGELAAREGEAWQKLIRVLTHEISNTAIPLTTLSAHVYEMLERREVGDPIQHEMLISMKVVRDRSRSLMNIVTGFKSIDRIPDPSLQTVPVSELLNQLSTMFAIELERLNITLHVETNEAHCIYADRNLTMQVLINIFRNAIEALEGRPTNRYIRVQSQVHDDGMHMFIRDNGCGIDSNHLDKVFVPFYSTKRNGSGIGLSISRQIMHRQRGNIVIRSSPQGTEINLTFVCPV